MHRAVSNPMLCLASQETPLALVVCFWEIESCIQWHKQRADVCSSALLCPCCGAQHATLGTNGNDTAAY